MAWKYPDASLRAVPPTHAVVDGYRRTFSGLTREEQDVLGYNEAIPVSREPFTEYETRWEKGADLILREVVVSSVVDEDARRGHLAAVIRAARDRLLLESDWTQLPDTPLTESERVAWTEYRAGLRDVPQQEGFPESADWPVKPA